MYDQISSLRDKGVQAAILGVNETESDENDDSPVLTSRWEGTREQIIQAGYEIVFSHPEAFLSCEDGLKVLRSTVYLSAVKAVIIDEAHCILEWWAKNIQSFKLDYFTKVLIVPHILDFLIILIMTWEINGFHLTISLGWYQKYVHSSVLFYCTVCIWYYFSIIVN